LLRRFAGYIEKQFAFKELVDGLADRRKRPQIPTSSVWLSVFIMFVTRGRSFNSLEQRLRRPRMWDRWVGPHKASADTIGRVMAEFELETLRCPMIALIKSAWRSKAVRLRPGQSMRIVSFDGHELWKSRARCCSCCQVRTVKEGSRKVKEYYHQVVVAQFAGTSPSLPLDLEMVAGKEGEIMAARRLLSRVLVNYSRLIDVITVDALYLEGPFLSQIVEHDKYFVAVMKQQNRDLYKDADALRQKRFTPKEFTAGNKQVRLWDIPDLSTFTTLGSKVRVVWAEEQTTTNKRVAGKLETETKSSTWIWATNLPQATVPAVVVQQWGHDRWDIENRCFNEMAAHWNMDHCFTHDINAAEALLLTLAIAFTTSYLFYARNLKPHLRSSFTRLELASRFLEDIALSPDSFLWSVLPAPD
jgi:hypothetical protein